MILGYILLFLMLAGFVWFLRVTSKIQSESMDWDSVEEGE